MDEVVINCEAATAGEHRWSCNERFWVVLADIDGLVMNGFLVFLLMNIDGHN